MSECVICDKEVDPNRYILCNRCGRVLHPGKPCSRNGHCADADADEPESTCKMAQRYHSEGRRKPKAVQQKRCPDCGGPLATGESHRSCSVCGYTEPEDSP